MYVEKKNFTQTFNNFFIEMTCVLNNNTTVVGCLSHSNKDCHVVTITPVGWLLFGIHIVYFRLWLHSIF